MCRSILNIIIVILIQSHFCKSQSCSPAFSDFCDPETFICSLDELNGYYCQSVDYSNPTACLLGSANCSAVPHNSSWWAFVSDGGAVSITLKFSNCTLEQGLQIGLVGACDCSEFITCNYSCTPGVSSITISANLLPCKTYYLWIDGCLSDVCTYSLFTSGGGPVKLSNFNFTRNGPSIVCKGCCATFMASPQQGLLCSPKYIWTIEGDEIKEGPELKTELCFPEEGTFSVCVKAIIENPSTGTTCDEITKCLYVNVAKKNDEIAKPRSYCKEELPIKWHSKTITEPGEYRSKFIYNGCCEYDSVIKISIYEPKTPDIIILGCENEFYFDSTTNIQFSGCTNKKEIKSNKKTSIGNCDSTYFISTHFTKLLLSLEYSCDSGQLVLFPSITNKSDTCGLPVAYQYYYRWHTKANNDSTISNQNKINIVDPEEYCLELKVVSKLRTAEKTCIFNYCESVNEKEFLEINNILGTDIALNGDTSVFTFPGNRYNIKKYMWRIEGGNLLDSLSTDPKSIFINWNNGNDSIGKVCLKIITDCFETKEFCKKITLKQKTSIYDQLNQENIHIFPNPNNGTFSIINNSSSQFKSIKIFNADGKEINFIFQKNNDNTKINLKTKAHGIYYIQLNTSQGIIHKKIMITN